MEESAKATGLQFAAIFYDYAAANATTTTVVTTTTASASSLKLIKSQRRFAWFWLRLRLI